MRPLVHALAQARARSDAPRVERLERALQSLSPALVVALVESHVWSDDDALDETDALPLQRRIDTLAALVPVLGDAGFERVVAQTKPPSFAFDPTHAHVGLWTSGAAGPDELLGRIAKRLADAGAVEQALAITERMLHLERRVAALLLLRTRLEPTRWLEATTRAARDARSFRGAVARFHALAWIAPLFGREEALALVREAIDALPPKERREWCHFPGGLMLMPLGGVIARALLRAGLDGDLVALAKELGTSFIDDDADDDAGTGAGESVEDALDDAGRAAAARAALARSRACLADGDLDEE